MGKLEEVFESDVYRVREGGFLRRYGRQLLRLLLVLLVSSAVVTVVVFNLPTTTEVVREVVRVTPVYHSVNYEELKPGMRIVAHHSLYAYNRVYPKTVPSLTKAGWIIVGFIRELYDPESVEFVYIVSARTECRLRIAVYSEGGYQALMNGADRPLREVEVVIPPYEQNGTLSGFVNEEVKDSSVYFVVENAGNTTAILRVDAFSRYRAYQYEEVEVEEVVLARRILLGLTVALALATFAVWWRLRELRVSVLSG